MALQGYYTVWCRFKWCIVTTLYIVTNKHRLAIYLHNVIFSFIIQSATPQNETLWISIIFPQFFPLSVSQIVFIFLLL